jgi:hypothetical protein
VPPKLLAPAAQQPRFAAALEGLLSICLEWQSESAEAATECDRGTAIDQFLTGLADDCEVRRQPGESNAALRTRLTEAPLGVARDEIVQIVNAILTGYGSTVMCRVFDSVLDRWFTRTDASAAANWYCFIGARPEWPDRQYSTADPPETGMRRSSWPSGAFAFADTVGRYFVIQVPPLDTTPHTEAMVAAAVNAVTVALGQSVRWSLWVEPNLIPPS